MPGVGSRGRLIGHPRSATARFGRNGIFRPDWP